MRGVILVIACALTLGAAAAFDDGDAIALLLNSHESQSPKVCAKAAERVRKSADAGGLLQRYVIAVLSMSPDAPEAARLDEAKRREWLDEVRPLIRDLAERKDNPLAWFLLSMESGDLAQLERAAEGGNLQALNAWGTYLVTTAATASTNAAQAKATLEKGFACFSAAAGKKDANGVYNLGMCYMQGLGCQVDAERAFECFRVAAEDGHPDAINNIGGCYRDGILVATNAAQAVRWFRKSAELGNTYGQLNYALALQRGDGIRRDEEKAAELLKDASEHGNIEAMTVYGMCLFGGRGVKQDREAAFRWFRRSAEGGFPPAMDNLAQCYGEGLGTPKDVLKSALWKMRAKAAMGDPEAIAWVRAHDAAEKAAEGGGR